MKSAGLVLAVVAGLVGGVVGAKLFVPKPAGSAVRESAYDHVMRTGTLRCGYGIWEPLLGTDAKTGERHGIMNDLTDEMVKLLNLKVEWTEQVDWNGMVAGMDAGRYDAVCSGKWVYGAEGAHAAYSAPLLYNVIHLYGRTGDVRFGNIAAANDPAMTVAVQDGGASEALAKIFFPKAKVVSIPAAADPSQQLLNVTTNKADVTIMDAATAQGFIEHNPGKLQLLTRGKPLKAYEVTYMFPLGDTKMAQMMDAGIRQLHTNGTVAQVLRKYVSAPETIYAVRPTYQPMEDK